ncbi:flagellar basal-body rod protein FlgG [Pelagicoccus sp. SDUM812005]|uniref:flagellar basal-body rod protein FlgG n=1 Tax=Pelagicoccus sp. SDUM812005 TaxID=3041257 RepID=UPI00280C6C8B|nr:flagellar basal-body rod protein FlgG [Pelagicoccus sp. SDUM812005]MDQ8182323.1 flagellar basal-body rod protein FlgG [Pelagicoccus sp. SDUM812005]
MSISLYSAASGMEAQQTNLNVISNNIANVSTTGFKKSKVEFQDMFYQVPKSVGADAGGSIVPTGIQVGTGTQVVSTSKVFTQGQVSQTGEDMDVAIVGDGFFQVTGPDGDSLYSRDGAFKVGPDGQVTNSQGMPIVGFPTPPAGFNNISINSNGGVTFTSDNGDILGTGEITLSRFANPAGLLGLGGNLFRQTEASGTPTVGAPGENGTGTLQQGYLETSNVNIVEEMVNMILAQRAYEINSKSIQTSDSMMQQVSQLKR